MRVVCIESAKVMEACPKIIKGNVYTVIGEKNITGWKRGLWTAVDGLYYELLEVGDKAYYHHSAFVIINEDQQDETEFERNYKKELV